MVPLAHFEAETYFFLDSNGLFSTAVAYSPLFWMRGDSWLYTTSSGWHFYHAQLEASIKFISPGGALTYVKQMEDHPAERCCLWSISTSLKGIFDWDQRLELNHGLCGEIKTFWITSSMECRKRRGQSRQVSFGYQMDKLNPATNFPSMSILLRPCLQS